VYAFLISSLKSAFIVSSVYENLMNYSFVAVDSEECE